MPFSPWTCMGLYTVSCLLDAVDGNAARYFNQCSKFGAVLDMVTDRSTTTCLLCYLSSIYPSWTIVFQLLISLDLSSHYMHMYSSLTAGASSHKKISKSSNRMLRAYYSDNKILFGVCALNELFFVALYLLSFEEDPTFPEWSVFPLYVLAIGSFPICAIKQVINIIQLVGASQNLAKVDVEDRKKAFKSN
ncbi:5928_t:CDS:2 [Ambispora leptoticha]|uniref:CDP-diacylglycerol--inositol 3-phosphatidyltransferase n=1 Tax=Ambispora leptoticha TaxID=144679 RepID=A0A9N8ZRR0_9GLOM|nr:5928_t:CDS:2 [Ambispora leptoticha]